jgi:anti-sigma regulatory factor (Ser/Thr protein kinase)
MATAAVVAIDPLRTVARYAVAGHPPPILAVDGSSVLLDEARSAPLGVLAGIERSEAEIAIPDGALLALYTDGLVERRDRPIDHLTRAIADTLAAEAASAERACDRLLQTALGGASPTDDVALLVMRQCVAAGLRFRFPASPTELAGVRRELRLWLDAVGVGPETARSILLAAGEACTNAVEHAYATDAGEVELEASIVGGTVEIVVRDAGAWRPERSTDRGRGLTMMRALMERVEIEHGEHGSVVRLTHPLELA